MVDVWLIILAVVMPFVLTFMNVVLLARYIDPAHAKGHFASKGVIVSEMRGHEAVVQQPHAPFSSLAAVYSAAGGSWGASAAF